MFNEKTGNGMLIKSRPISLKAFAGTLFFLLICRIVSMWLVPLNDTTEARYGEIARIMQETGNWITPMHQYGQPFWAKPPLSIWLSAVSMKYFGVSAFAARLPALCLSIGVLMLVFNLMKRQRDQASARLSVLVLASSIFFYIDAGTVMTDPALLFCISLTWIAFWHAFVFGSKRWGYLFFVALGLGLLAKGPVAVVLPISSLLVWVIWQKQWRKLWQSFPWISGSVLLMLIAMPWYGLAELHTPGFLKYFLLGENIQRFLQPGWSGDKYGYVHHVTYGTIWIYALAGMFPWIIPGMTGCIRLLKMPVDAHRDDPDFVRYLIACTTVPLLFFTFAHNVIYPYVFPILPPFAMLLVELHRRIPSLLKRQASWVILSSFSGVALLCVTFIFYIQPSWIEKSQHRVIHVFNQKKTLPNSQVVYWDTNVHYSAQFYSNGHAAAVHTAPELETLFAAHPEDMLVVNRQSINEIPVNLLKQFKVIADVSMLKDEYLLMQKSA